MKNGRNAQKSILSLVLQGIGAIIVVAKLLDILLQTLEHLRYWVIRRGIKERREERRKQGQVLRKRKKVAIVTGASAGLGRAYAKEVASQKKRFGVNEIWLIARRLELMEELAEKLELPVKVFALDLTEEDDLQLLEEELEHAYVQQEQKGARFEVSLLINNAGKGRIGASQTLGYEEEHEMIDINNKAAVAVTNLVVPFMRPGARIMEICSVASFHPIPKFNAYAATKAFLYSYTRGLRAELLKKGISVTAVCPYWIKDTEFLRRATRKSKKVWLATSAKEVVKWSMRDAKKDRAVSTPGLVATLDYALRKCFPTTLITYFLKMTKAVS